MIKKILMINGTQRTLVVEGHESLAEVLRDRLLLTGCKIGCGEGHCGACYVIVDGKVTRSCITKIAKVPAYAKIETYRRYRYSGGPSSSAGGLDRTWLRTVRILFARLYYERQSASENNPSPSRTEVREWFIRTGISAAVPDISR